MVEVQLLQPTLVREAFSGYVDKMVLRQIKVLEVGVKLHGAVDGFDLVVSDDESLDRGIECDGEDVKATLFADHDQGVVVAVAAAGAVGKRSRAALRCQDHQ